jgi:enoyl-CoA hydratase/carnithine racemase
MVRPVKVRTPPKRSAEANFAARCPGEIAPSSLDVGKRLGDAGRVSDVDEVLISYPTHGELVELVGEASATGLSEGHIELITINRPEARNSLTHSAYASLETAIRQSKARCIIITGTDPAFCSGDDVRQVMAPAGKANPSERLAVNPRITPAADALLTTNVPIIAAVNGAAVGWGMELALMADLRILSEKARFGELFVLRGLVSDVAGLGRLSSLVGRERAAELLFTGRVVNAEEAMSIGLALRCVPHEELITEALRVAASIARNPPLAVGSLKAGLRLAVDPNWQELGVWVSSTLAILFATEDHREGVQSFLEKRPATFHGR